VDCGSGANVSLDFDRHRRHITHDPLPGEIASRVLMLVDRIMIGGDWAMEMVRAGVLPKNM
jgi:hypothetical protein